MNTRCVGIGMLQDRKDIIVALRLDRYRPRKAAEGRQYRITGAKIETRQMQALSPHSIDPDARMDMPGESIQPLHFAPILLSCPALFLRQAF